MIKSQGDIAPMAQCDIHNTTDHSNCGCKLLVCMPACAHENSQSLEPSLPAWLMLSNLDSVQPNSSLSFASQGHPADCSSQGTFPLLSLWVHLSGLAQTRSNHPIWGVMELDLPPDSVPVPDEQDTEVDPVVLHAPKAGVSDIKTVYLNAKLNCPVYPQGESRRLWFQTFTKKNREFDMQPVTLDDSILIARRIMANDVLMIGNNKAMGQECLAFMLGFFTVSDK